METPKLLYKFVSSTSAIEAMMKGSLKFTPIEELNDPNEIFPIYNEEAVEKSLYELRSREKTQADIHEYMRQELIMKRLSPETQAFPAPRTVEELEAAIHRNIYDNMDIMRSHLEQTIKLIRKRIGILSLTEVWKNFAMWAYYAANATGACLVYKGLDEVFSGDNTKTLNQPISVTYNSSNPRITFDPKSDRTLFLAKLPEWSHEKEWRIARPLAECEKKSERLFTVDLDKKYIAGVICGWKMPDDTIVKIKNNALKNRTQMSIWRAVVDSSGELQRENI